MLRIKKLLLTALACLPLSVCADEWAPKTAPIMTTWGENIDPDNVWKEYPRPQMTRSDWMNLNGLWGYFCRLSRMDYSYEADSRKFAKQILVPFPIESALSGIMSTTYDANTRSTFMYRRTFTLPAAYSDKNVLLHFGAVDWKCVIYINGKEAGNHTGGNDPFFVDITPYLNASGEQEIVVAVTDPTNKGGQPVGKQSVTPSGMWYTPVSGIWQTVWLEPVNPVHVTDYEVIPDIDHSSLTLKVLCDDPTATANVNVIFKGKTVATVNNVKVNENKVIGIPDQQLWSPDTPNLYDLKIDLMKNGQKVDEVGGYFGMRKFSRAMADGRPCLMLNNEPLFLMGPLDQGWWPDGLLTPPSYEAMVFDLKATKELGMNMTRKHIKVEPALWYEWCDRNGLVVWQDMPSGGTQGTIGSINDIKNNFYDECIRIVNALKQHPSIGAWVPFNEGWGQFDGLHTVRGVNAVRNADADSGRLMNSVTGWTDYGLGDFYDRHNYPVPDAYVDEAGRRISSCGEYGGITMLVEDHQWAGSQWVYTSVDNNEDYTDLFIRYLDELQNLQQEKGLWAAVYTQITDVEQELNGIYTYDRKVLKVTDEQHERIKSRIQQIINQRRYRESFTIVKAADESDHEEWQYTFSQPEEGWEKEGFDDSGWKTGIAGFGDRDPYFRTSWTGDDHSNIWIRRSFTLDGLNQADLNDLKLWMFHDDDVEVYLNGVLACAKTKWNDKYEFFEITDEAKAVLRLNGDNVIAIHARQDYGGRYIDAGIKLVRDQFVANTDLEISPAQTIGRAVMLTSELELQSWKYTFENLDVNAGDSWTAVGWNDENMKVGNGGFGGILNHATATLPAGSVVSTSWTTNDIYLRKNLDLTGYTRQDIDNFIGRIYHDENVRVYFNGVEAFSADGYISNYMDIELNQEALDALNTDDSNVIAIHCHNQTLGAYIDFGIYEISELPLVTGIVSVEMDVPLKPADGIYNLSGQLIRKDSRCVSGLAKGIYIIDGKKTVIK